MLVKLPLLILIILFLQQAPSFTQGTNQDYEQRIKALQSEVNELKASLNSCGKKLGACIDASRGDKACACCDDKIQSYQNRIDLLTSENKKLRDIYEAEKISSDKLKRSYNEAVADKNKLAKQNEILLRAIDELEIKLGNKSSEYAEVFQQSEKVKSEIAALNAEKKENVEAAPIAIAEEETYKTLLAANDVSNQKPNDGSVEYRTITEDGKTYQIRELMIGTLLFPDPSELLIEPKQPLDIKVIFRPNALLKSSTAEGKTKWFLEFAFAPDKIKDFSYDDKRSKDDQRRMVGDEGEEVWIWKAEKDQIPDNFSIDKPYIQIDASAEINDKEISKKTIENKQIEIKEKPIPGVFATAFKLIKDNLVAILAVATAIFGFGATYFSFKEKRTASEMKKQEARNEELKRRIETPEESIHSQADSEEKPSSGSDSPAEEK